MNYRSTGQELYNMDGLHRLCMASRNHPLPVKMVHIGTVRDPRYGFQWILACPVCNRREGWIVGYNGRPFCLWGGYNNPRWPQGEKRRC